MAPEVGAGLRVRVKARIRSHDFCCHAPKVMFFRLDPFGIQVLDESDLKRLLSLSCLRLQGILFAAKPGDQLKHLLNPQFGEFGFAVGIEGVS